MLVKFPIKRQQSLSNRREILLADQAPELIGGALRTRVAQALDDTIVTSQWGDGFGGGNCGLWRRGR